MIFYSLYYFPFSQPSFHPYFFFPPHVILSYPYLPSFILSLSPLFLIFFLIQHNSHSLSFLSSALSLFFFFFTWLQRSHSFFFFSLVLSLCFFFLLDSSAFILSFFFSSALSLSIFFFFFWQKCKTDPLTFSLFHFSPLTFNFCQCKTPL